jgi:transposase
LDNAAIHFGGVNDDLGHRLWSHHGVFLLALPTRSPELNPIEFIWNMLVQRLKAYPLAPLQGRPHAVAYAIMSEITHANLAKCYKNCNYL